MTVVPSRHAAAGLLAVLLVPFFTARVSPAADERQPAPAAPAPAATQPSEVEESIAKSFAGLADDDAAVRESARAELLGMERRHLPVLKQVVERTRPLVPSQVVGLRSIVTHVYLAGDPYPSDPGAGFLGVRMYATIVNLPKLATPPPPQADAEDVEAAEPGAGLLPDGAGMEEFLVGVVIAERIPGFVGARMLREGDVVIGLPDRAAMLLDTPSAFTEAVRATRPGDAVNLLLLRRGRLVKVAVPLDPRPLAADQGRLEAMDLLDRERRKRAEAYWREQFAPLLSERVG